MSIADAWIWGIIGLVLLTLEMASGTFYILWFGVAAIAMCFFTWIFPNTPFYIQLFLYALLAVGLLAIWRHFYKKNSIDSRVGQSQGDEIGMIGTVIHEISPKKNGRIKFTQGVMGSREWTAVANEAIAVGEEASIIRVEGNTVRVKKYI